MIYLTHFRKWLYIACIGCIVYQAQAQNKNYYSRNKGKLGNGKYHMLNLGTGFNTLQIQGFTPSVHYNYDRVDLSSGIRSTQEYGSSMKIPSRSAPVGNFMIGYEVGKYRGLFGNFNFGVMTARGFNYFFDLGLGYNLKSKYNDDPKVIWMPSIAYSVSESDWNFGGSINNRHADIYVFGDRYPYTYITHNRHGSQTHYSYSVQTKLKNYAGGLKFQMGAWLFPKAKIQTRINVGYFVPMYSGSGIRIHSSAHSSHLISYTDSRLGYESHSTLPSNQAYQYKGLYCSIVFGIKF